jgi:uncharacterized RDD family membrane protein YckC
MGLEAVAAAQNASYVEDVAKRLDAPETIFRRGIGAWVDFAVLGLVLLLAVFGLGEQFAGPALILVGLFWLGYFPVTEVLWGRSLGKLVTGLVVVDAQGHRPSVGKAVIRTVLRLVEVNPFLLGGVPAGVLVAISPHRQRLGDMAAGTYVIPIKSLVPQVVQTVAGG